jgi:predicted SAM-dependent methyltransferase
MTNASWAARCASRIPERLKPPLGVALRSYRWIRRSALHASMSLLRPSRLARFKGLQTLRLNVGCGPSKYAGWVNIDIEPVGDLVVDITKGLPFDSNSVDLIYSEHVLEHFTFEEGQKVLWEFARCLKKEGIVRIAMPDLDCLIQKYNSDWKNQDWLSRPEYEFITTRGRMINTGFSGDGHKYLYNEEDLRNHLTEAGFQRLARCERNVSDHRELADLETRKDSTLVMEATKL